MYLNKNIFKKFLVLILLFSTIVLISFSNICKSGVQRGMLICANVIIPSLFPFLVCILCLINMNINLKNKFISKLIFFCFGQNFELFLLMLFSMVGGYPVGCKLINRLYAQEKLSKKCANIMQMYCINAGPAFIITAIGNGVLGNKAFGIILFFSHIFASIIIAICMSKSMKKFCKCNNVVTPKNTNFADMFVKSTADAAQSIITICIYIILFSVINSYLIYFLNDIPILKYIFYFTEVTTSITKTKNIYLISFLLGFSGFSIWCQIFSLSKNAKIDLKLFILGRILHGGISCIITYLILKIFKITNAVYSNSIIKHTQIFYSNVAVSFSLLVMLIVLLIYIYSKNSCRNIIDDMI